ncbi:hypothetical protein [Gordonia sp. MP11Mi]
MRGFGEFRVVLSGVAAVVATPIAAASTALVWKFPVFMGGVIGGVGATLGAALIAVVWLTIGSLMLGSILVYGLGAFVGYKFRRSPIWVGVAAGVAVGAVVAVTYAVIGACCMGV